MAATHENKKVDRCFNREENALLQQWHQIGFWTPGGEFESVPEWLWCNPPYSKPNLQLFTEKARMECEKGAAMVFLVPATPGAGWFQRLVQGLDCIGARTTNPALPPALQGWDVELVGNGGWRLTVRFLKRRIQFFNPHRDVDGGSAKTDSMLLEFRPARLT